MKQVRLLIFITSILFANSLVANSPQTKYRRLQSLFSKKIACDNEIPPDSTIKWSEELSPQLLQEENYDAYYQIQFFTVSAYCALGDISLAVDLVSKLLEDAVARKSDLGFALACIGIGDTYTYSVMPEVAVQSYVESLELLRSIPDTYRYRELALLRIVYNYLSEDRIDEAQPYIKELNELVVPDREDVPCAYTLMYTALFYVKSNAPDKAWTYLAETRKIIEEETESIRSATFHTILADYYESKNLYGEALAELNKISPGTEKILPPSRYTKLAIDKARLYQELGMNDKAALLYRDIVNRKDSLSTQSYIRQVNTLRTKYQVNQMELSNQEERNKQTGFFISVGLGVLFVGTLFSLYIIRSNKQLKESKEKLAKAKVKAENSTKAKSLILSNMSHEIRTPLNALSGFSTLLIEDMIDNATRLQCNDIIQQNSELLMKLIDDVIDLSSLEFGKMQFNLQNHDVVKICRNVADTVEKVKQTSAHVVFKTPLDELTLYTDEARLQQVLLNLMINATKFTPSGEITLELTLLSQGMAFFTVTDTGCGIPLEKQKKIFERFEKLNEQAQGTGLGLSICQLIINHVGGEIWIDPEYTQGSRFCFTHPIQPAKI